MSVWALALTSVAFFMVFLDSLVVVTALPAIHRDLGGGLSTLEWTVNAYSLTVAAGIITGAALGDRLGRRGVFAAGLILFALASAACALAPSVAVLVAARAAQGAGAALVIPLSLTILTSAFPAERRGTVVGVWGGLSGLAVAAGPLVGGAMTEGLSWHWVFWINVPIGLAAAGLSAWRLAETRGPATALDLPAVGLVSGGAAGVVWGLVRGHEAGWTSPETIAALTAGVLLLAGFVAWERRVPEAMLPPRLFRNRAFSAACATAFLMSAAIFATTFLASQYFQLALDYSPLGTGLRFLPMTATPVVVTPLAGIASDRVGRRPVIVTGLLLQGAGLGSIALLAAPDTAYGLLVGPLAAAGTGFSMALAATPAAVISAAPPRDVGRASGVTNTLQRFGAVFGIAVGSAVFAANGHLGTAAAFTAGFRPAFAVIAGFAVLAAVIALAVGGGPAETVPAGRSAAA